MSFLDADERLIIMDISGAAHNGTPPNLLTREELKQLKGAGIKTIYFQGAVRWDEMQKGPREPICWDALDRYMDNIESAGLKALLPFIYSCPRWKPPEWFLLYLDILFPSCPSYTNPAAAADLDELLMTAICRYIGRPAEFVYAIPIDGEFAFPLVPNRSEPDFPLDVFIDWVVRREKIFETQCGEVWSAWHLIDSPSWTDAMYRTLRDWFPTSDHYAIQFTHYSQGGNQVEKVRHVAESYGVKYFGGAEYVQGLRHSVPACIEQGMHGLICAPVYPGMGHERITPWMLDEIQWAAGALNVH